MPDRFDKFNDDARTVLTRAQEESQRFNHNYIGTEHLLLGLLRVEDSVGARVLRQSGVSLAQMRAEVWGMIGRAESPPNAGIGLTLRAKKVIELVVDEARHLGHHYIGTEHILLGLIREGEGIAAGILASHGVDLEQLRAKVYQTIAEGGAPPPNPPQSSESGSVLPKPPLPSERGSHPPASPRVTESGGWRMAGSAMRFEESPSARRGFPPEMSELTRVVAIGQSQTVGATEITLLSLEIYDAGAILNGRIRRRPASEEFRFPRPTIALTDEQGTSYAVWPGGGYGNSHDQHLSWSFSPPPRAPSLRVEIPELQWQAVDRASNRLVPGPAETGPWAFAIPISEG